jgi:hypothetical protein
MFLKALFIDCVYSMFPVPNDKDNTVDLHRPSKGNIDQSCRFPRMSYPDFRIQKTRKLRGTMGKKKRSKASVSQPPVVYIKMPIFVKFNDENGQPHLCANGDQREAVVATVSGDYCNRCWEYYGAMPQKTGKQA